MQSVYQRKLSINERMFLASASLSPVANQIVVEGNGTDNLSAWQSAVDAASMANPGSRVVLKGSLGLCRWQDSGISPPVRQVDGSKWDGKGPEGAPFLDNALNAEQGPTCEILLVKGHPATGSNTVRVIFRTHHAVMDGRGTLFWMEDMLRALAGLEPIGSNSAITDSQLARSIQKKFRRPINKKFIAPTGKAIGHEPGVQWCRFEIPGPVPQILARSAVILAKEAWSYKSGPVLFGIPVDLRRHRTDLTSTANLSYSIYIEVSPGASPGQIADDIQRQLQEKREGMLSWEDDLYHFIPLKLISRQALKIINARHASESYSISGFLSNLGKIPVERFPDKEFEVHKVWAIPPSIEYAPFSMVLTGYYDEISVMLAAPRRLATGGRLNKAASHLAQKLGKF